MNYDLLESMLRREVILQVAEEYTGVSARKCEGLSDKVAMVCKDQVQCQQVYNNNNNNNNSATPTPRNLIQVAKSSSQRAF